MTKRYLGGIIGVNMPNVTSAGGASGIWNTSLAAGYKNASKWPLIIEAATPSQVAYTSPGTYVWTAPAGVTKVSVVCVGGGGGGSSVYATGFQLHAGGGGGLGWKNNIPVVPGQGYVVVVGAGGLQNGVGGGTGGNSYFISDTLVCGIGGTGLGVGGSYVGDGGGNGGNTAAGQGGGGAGGYTGNGGAGGAESGNPPAQAGSGGGGAGGYGTTTNEKGGSSGGGVGLLGQGANGAVGASIAQYTQDGGGGGSGGGNGGTGNYRSESGAGGAFGGGGGGGGYYAAGGIGGSGAVRIIWGNNRAFPASNAGNV